MTTCTVTFDTGNAAFDDGNGPEEAARALRIIAGKVSSGQDGGSVFDSNGNRIGEWSVDYPEQDEGRGRMNTITTQLANALREFMAATPTSSLSNRRAAAFTAGLEALTAYDAQQPTTLSVVGGDHTPEPWKVWDGRFIVRDDDFSTLAECHGFPNSAADRARRIVACVNACAGVSDPASLVAELAACRAALKAIEYLADADALGRVGVVLVLDSLRARLEAL